MHQRIFLLLLALFLPSLPACLARPTVPPSAQGVRWGIITDVHYAERPTASGRYYGSALGKTDGFVAAMNAARPDFVLELGDFKDQDATAVKVNTLKYLTTVEAHFAAFKGPTYHVLGNHDMDSLSKAEFQARVVNTNISPAQTYYSFDRGGIHFVVLDGNFKADGTPYDSGNFDWKDANIPLAQRDWLTADLAAHRRPTVVFVHQRLDLADTADGNIKQGAEVRQILEHSRQMLAVFSGHEHGGGYTLINGIHYLTLVGAIEAGADLVAGNAYALVSVSQVSANSYRLDVQGTGRQPSRTNLLCNTALPVP